MRRTSIVIKTWQYGFVCSPDFQDRNKTECEPASSETITQGEFSKVALLEASYTAILKLQYELCLKNRRVMQGRAFRGALPCQASMSTAGAQTSSRVEEMFKMMEESNSTQGRIVEHMLHRDSWAGKEEFCLLLGYLYGRLRLFACDIQGLRAPVLHCIQSFP